VNLRDTLRSAEFRTWNALSVYCTERLSGQFSASYERLVAAFNDALANVVSPAGVSCVDETILPYEGVSAYLITIPRKPHDTGLRIFVQTIPLTASGRPVLARVLPELCRPCYSPLAVLDTLVLRPYSGPYTTTCDSYLGSVAWLSAHPLAPSFHALSSTTCPFYELLKYDLQPDTYRVFSNGSVHISIWFDVEIHVCATNAVAAVSSAVSSSPSPLLGTSFLQVQQLPTTLIPILMQASTDDLKALAGRAGVSTDGNKSELVHRIVGQPCSSSSAVSSSSTSSPSAGLETYKLSELKAELMRLGQRTSGNKRRLLERLKRVRASSGSVASSRQRVLGFIGASAPSSHSSPPIINGFYASSFNLVDEFNRLVALVEYRPRITSEVHRVVISLVEFAAVTTFVLCQDNYLVDHCYPSCSSNLRTFTTDLANQIMAQEKPLVHSPFRP